MLSWLQWTFLALVVAVLAAWFYFKGGNGPCFDSPRRSPCVHSTGSKYP